MTVRPLALLRSRNRPPLLLGIMVGVLSIAVETLLAAALTRIIPVHALDVLYLAGVLVVAIIWGIGLGAATALASILAFDYFVLPPVGRLTPAKSEDWALLVVFIYITLLASWIARLGRSLAAEVDAHAEADLAAGLGRLLLRTPDLETALPAAAHDVSRRLGLRSAAIELQPTAGDGAHVAFPMGEDDALPTATLIVPADLPRATMRRLRERVVPSLGMLLEAARERERIAAALKASRDELRRIVDEQAALRRLATLVAHGRAPAEVYGAVAREVGQIVGARHVEVMRYEPDNAITTVGAWNEDRVVTMPIGSRWPLAKGSVSELVWRTGAPGRVDAYEGDGALISWVQKLGIISAVGCPIVVGQRLWGTVIASSTTGPLPEGTEERMLEFTELLAAAIANAEGSAALKASRARVVAAADATRSLIERDLHARTQQRLVALALEVRATEAMVPPQLGELREGLSYMAQALQDAMEELREITRGLHPALLSTGGLEPALKALARRSSVPVRLNMCADRRLPEGLEVAVYYIVEEALTNAGKHARASEVCVDLAVTGTTVRLSVRDDGVGGADPDRGSGLVGLQDRVGALGGHMEIISPVGAGTTLLAGIPIDEDR